MTAVEISGDIILWDIGVIILAATVSAIFARILKQPLILGYMLAGIIIGPNVMGLIASEDIVKTFAELGMTLLLFVVGLELDLGRLKDVGKVSMGCGLGQIIITFIFGYAIATLLGFTGMESFYIAFALTISSTMVVIKLLSDREELDTLHGKIVLGTLLVQDIATIIVLGALPHLGSLGFSFIVDSMQAGVGIVILAIVANRYLIPRIMDEITKSIELLLLFALSWCFIFSAIAYLLNFSFAIGAFLAGVSLAAFPYNIEIIGRVRSLRDFFSTIFFVSLGMEVPLTIALIQPAIVLSFFVLVGNIIIMMFITRFFGYGIRTSFLTALSLAQISEFSLIMADVGYRYEHINEDIFSLIAFVAMATIVGSTYFIVHSDEIYRRILPLLKPLHSVSERKDLDNIPSRPRGHIVLFGCHRMGCVITKVLQAAGEKFVVVDINPEVIKSLIRQNIQAVYGDIGDIEVLTRVNLKDVRMVISTIPNKNDNLFLIKETRSLNPDAIIFVTANHIRDSLDLYKHGADYVILPHMLGGEKISEILSDYIMDKRNITDLKKSHIIQLEELKRIEFLLTDNMILL
ncbi:MAG TPA: sodium:proton exchanger [Candidatus Altiarchaeales archaeon]|nr:sodium:proton exchanger [Candidatus Altiarchaeales archaeon]